MKNVYKIEGMPAIYTQNQLDEVAAKLKTRPRKTLGFRTPAQVFEEALH
jgi:IS30 family transposase